MSEVKRKPSEQLIEQMAFTPFHPEDVGMLMDLSQPELYLFSRAYAHEEGTTDPIGKFERFLTNRDEMTKDLFYSENFLRLFPGSRV